LVILNCSFKETVSCLIHCYLRLAAPWIKEVEEATSCIFLQTAAIFWKKTYRCWKL